MKRAFISFDYDHDLDLKNLLVGQSKHPDTDFEILDASIKQHLMGDWREKARRRIGECDLVIVICGEHTHTAQGVADELAIAKEEGIPHFFLWGRNGKRCYLPSSAMPNETIYDWTWNNLKILVRR